MNSAQRRQARRGFPHMVTVRPNDSEKYFEHDNRVDAGRAWCRRQLTNGSWRAMELWDEAIFYFAKEQDATYFALKWT